MDAGGDVGCWDAIDLTLSGTVNVDVGVVVVVAVVLGLFYFLHRTLGRGGRNFV